MKIEQARENIGKTVTYRPHGGPLEVEVITSVGPSFVFVRYGADTGSKATFAQDLELEFPGTTPATPKSGTEPSR